jgi:hypothetical protein
VQNEPAAAVGREQQVGVGCERQRGAAGVAAVRARARAQDQRLVPWLVVPDVPDDQGAVAGAGADHPAVRRERQVRHRCARAGRGLLAPFGQVDDLERAVGASAREHQGVAR